MQRSPLRFSGAEAAADVIKLVAALNTEGLPFIVPPGVAAPDPSLGEENQFAIQPSTFKLWQKVGGLWVFVGVFKGWSAPAPWKSTTAYAAFNTVTLNGSSYFALVDNTNVSPDSDPATWQLIAAKGLDGATYTASSVSSLTVTTGSKTFTIATGRGYTVGQRLRAASAADPTNYMEGLVASYSGATLTMTIDRAGGSGTHADWNINVAGDTGSQGTKGDTGSGYGGTSTSSVAVGIGSKTFATQPNLAYTVGGRVRVSSGTAYMEGLVTAYDAVTGSLTVNTDNANGSGTLTVWNINLAGDPGSPLGQKVDYVFVATAAQSTFSGPDSHSQVLSYTAGALEIAVNGLKMPFDKYTASDGTSIVLTAPLNDGDVLDVLAFAAFNPADTLAKSANGADIVNKAAFRANLGVGVPVVRSNLAGLQMATAGSAATFGVGAGTAADSTNVDMLALGSSLTKSTSAWAFGNNNGALDTGAIAANTWYHVYVIKRADTGVVDVLVSLSASAPTLPANYSLFRRIGAMKTDGSAKWTAFFQIGDRFIWAVTKSDYANFAGLSTSIAALNISVPTGIVVEAEFHGVYTNSGAGQTIIFFDGFNGNDVSVAPGAASLYDAVGGVLSFGTFRVFTNTSAQINAKTSAASGNALYVATRGWIDRRGRDD